MAGFENDSASNQSQDYSVVASRLFDEVYKTKALGRVEYKSHAQEIFSTLSSALEDKRAIADPAPAAGQTSKQAREELETTIKKMLPAGDAQGIAADMNTLEKRNLPDMSVATTYQQVNRLLTADGRKDLTQELRRELAEGILHNSAHPEQLRSDDNSPFSDAAKPIESHLYSQHPEKVSQTLADAALGRMDDGHGHRIPLPESLASLDAKDARLAREEAMQVLQMEATTLRKPVPEDIQKLLDTDNPWAKITGAYDGGKHWDRFTHELQAASEANPSLPRVELRADDRGVFGLVFRHSRADNAPAGSRRGDSYNVRLPHFGER